MYCAVLTRASWATRDGSVRNPQCFSPEIAAFSLLRADTLRNLGDRTGVEIGTVAADAQKLAPVRDTFLLTKSNLSFESRVVSGSLVYDIVVWS